MHELRGQNFAFRKIGTTLFRVYNFDATFDEKNAAIYIIAHQNQSGYRDIYVDEIADLSELSNYLTLHPESNCFRLHSANCICIYEKNDLTHRRLMTAAFKQRLNPACQ